MNLQIDNYSLWIKINKLHQGLGRTQQELRYEFMKDYEADSEPYLEGYDEGFYKGQMKILEVLMRRVETIISEEANEHPDR